MDPHTINSACKEANIETNNSARGLTHTHKETHKQKSGQQLLIILGFLHYFQAKARKQSQEITFFYYFNGP